MLLFYPATTTAELVARGMTRWAVQAAVRTGALIHARRGVYVDAAAPDAVVRAVRVGGRLTCLSLLSLLGVFVYRVDALHVHVERGSSRLRSPHDRRRRLEPRAVRGVRLHWLPLVTPASWSDTQVSIVDALVHAVLCQAPRHAVATLDSAIQLGFASMVQIDEVFRALPAKCSVLRALIDGRAESGPETLMRLMLRGLGCTIELQVPIAGVGRVDLVVDGWLVIECDSEAHHGGWAKQEADRLRDLRLAARGYTSLRPTAVAIMDHPDLVLAAVRGLLQARRA